MIKNTLLKLSIKWENNFKIYLILIVKKILNHAFN